MGTDTEYPEDMNNDDAVDNVFDDDDYMFKEKNYFDEIVTFWGSNWYLNSCCINNLLEVIPISPQWLLNLVFVAFFIANISLFALKFSPSR